MSLNPGKGPGDPEGTHAWKTRVSSGLCLLYFFGEGIVYNVLVLALLLPASGNRAWVAPLAVLFNTLWLLAFWSYVQVHRSSPGVVTDKWKEFVSTSGIVVVSTRRMWQPGMATLCQECDMPRPERSHHCKRCGYCVLRFDHHCPWINNCVGFLNHKYFMLVGVYAWALALVYCCTSLPELARLCIRMCTSVWDPSKEVIGWATPFVFVSAWAFSLQALVLLSQMLFCYIPLAACNLTRVEELIVQDCGAQSNPYDRGSPIANLSQTFGALGIDWLIPIPPVQPVSDGMSFPRRGDPFPPEEVAAAKATAPELLDSCISAWRCWSTGGNWSSRPTKEGRILTRTADTEDDYSPESRWLRRYRVRPPREVATKTPRRGGGFWGGFLLCRGEVQEEEEELYST